MRLAASLIFSAACCGDIVVVVFLSAVVIRDLLSFEVRSKSSAVGDDDDVIAIHKQSFLKNIAFVVR